MTLLTCTQLVEHDSEGQCGSECKTIERACQEVKFQKHSSCDTPLELNAKELFIHGM